MPVYGYYNYYSKLRLSGMASGLDTDAIVSSLIRVERMPLDKLQQKRQLTEWRQDDYREIINLLRGFKDEYFNYLKPASNMLSQSNYKMFTIASSNSSIVSATGGVGTGEGTHTISVINLATADQAVGASGITKGLEGAKALNGSDVSELSGKKFVLVLDGISREITIGSYSTVNELASGLESAIRDAFGEGKVFVSNVDGKLNFSTGGGANKIVLQNGYSNNGLESLGFSAGDSNRLDTSRTLSELADKFSTPLTFDENGKLQFTINSKPFTFDQNITLSGMLNAINGDSTAKVNIVYDEMTDKFIITAKQLGAGNNIDISQTGGNFFDGASGISTVNTVTREGEDATVKLDGVVIKRSSNTFTVNGVTYNLLKAHDDPDNQSETLAIKVDVDGIYKKIEEFVNKYNEVIDKINAKLSEEYDSDYLPLTDEQKEAMTEEEIEKWEKKAKTGLLRNDSILSRIVYDMRKAVYDSIEGLGLGIYSIGITTENYAQKGKLRIDEKRLKEAILADPDGVMNIFAKQSSSVPNYSRTLTSDQMAARYKEQGIVHRLYDIIENNITTFRDENGRKGILLEKAGLIGDASEFNNSIYWQLKDYDKSISNMLIDLYRKEESLYIKYATMEKLLGQMYSQSNWLAMQFNSGN